jgi:hypothetical protein
MAFSSEVAMSKSPGPVVLHLKNGQIIAADAAWLSVVRGRVWVTQAGDPDDHFLEDGQAMRLAAGTRALVGAEGPAQVALMRAPSIRQILLTRVSQWAPRFTRRRSWT